MQTEFFITNKAEGQSLFEEYHKMYSTLGIPRFLPNPAEGHTIYDILPEYGQGTIEIFVLKDNVHLFLFNHTFKKEIITKFDLNQEYFEIEFCIDGHFHIVEQNGQSVFSKNQLSISLPQATSGKILREANTSYQGVSITTTKTALSSYFGSLGVDAWDDYMGRISNQIAVQQYLGRETSLEIQNIFHKIFYAHIPSATKPLFFESKIMELFSELLAEEQKKEEQLLNFSSFEIEQIKKIPHILLENRYSLPDLDFLAEQLSLNKKTMSAGFKQLYGDTIFRYYRALLLNQATFLLLETDKNINEIALELGYSSSSNFCYAFKKQYEISPLEYRAQSSYHQK